MKSRQGSDCWHFRQRRLNYFLTSAPLVPTVTEILATGSAFLKPSPESIRSKPASASGAAVSEVIHRHEADAKSSATSHPARSQLFRQEALDARSSQRLGPVMLAQPIANNVAAGAAAVIIVAICCFAWFGTYTRKATVSGELSPGDGVLRIVPAASGLVTEVLVKEGQVVAAGDPLFMLSGERISGSGPTQKLIGEQLGKRQALLVRNARLAEERHAERLRGSEDRLNAIDNELTQLDAEAALLDGRERIGQSHVRRQEESVRTGFVSQAALELAQSELMALQGQRQALARAKASLERDRAAVQASRREAALQLKGDTADVEAAVATLSQEASENDARNLQVIKAPFAATVSGLSTQQGHFATPATVLATLIPSNVPLVAHLYATSAQIGFVEIGQQANLRYHAFPYQKFGMALGQVIDVTSNSYAPQELPAHVASILASNIALPVYRITVELDQQALLANGSNYALRAGMTVEADIFQDKRRLYEWALEPVYAVTRKLNNIRE